MKRASGAALALALLGAACHGAPEPAIPEIPRQLPPSPPPVIEWSTLSGPIKAIDVNSADATLAPKVKEALASIVGKPLDRRELRRGLTAVLALHGVAEASAHGTQLADGIQVVVDVKPQPTLHALAARELGGPDLPLPAQLTSAIGSPVDPQLVDAFGVQLRDLYLAKGFTDATVAWKQSDAGGGALDVVVEITPGKPSTISSLDFKGNAHVKKADLVKTIGDGFAPSSPWNTDLVERGQLALTSYYYDHGYVAVAIAAPKPIGGPSPAVFTITEGDQYRVGKIGLFGIPTEETAKYLGLIGVKQGDIFNRTALSAGLSKLNDLLKSGGGGAPSGTAVTPYMSVDEKKKNIDLSFCRSDAPCPPAVVHSDIGPKHR